MRLRRGQETGRARVDQGEPLVRLIKLAFCLQVDRERPICVDDDVDVVDRPRDVEEVVPDPRASPKQHLGRPDPDELTERAL